MELGNLSPRYSGLLMAVRDRERSKQRRQRGHGYQALPGMASTTTRKLSPTPTSPAMALSVRRARATPADATPVASSISSGWMIDRNTLSRPQRPSITHRTMPISSCTPNHSGVDRPESLGDGVELRPARHAGIAHERRQRRQQDQPAQQAVHEHHGMTSLR